MACLAADQKGKKKGGASEPHMGLGGRVQE